VNNKVQRIIEKMGCLIDKTRYVFRKSIEKSILTNLGILLIFLALYLYAEYSSGEGYFFAYLLILPCFYLIGDMRTRIIIDKGQLRYVRLIGSKKAPLEDVALIQATYEPSGSGSNTYIEIKDKEGSIHFKIPPQVLPKNKYKKFERVVKAHNPETIVNFDLLTTRLRDLL